MSLVVLPVEESIAELGERLEGLLGVDDKRIARHHVLVVVVHDGYEGVRGWLGADADAREVALEQVADERGLTRGVLAHQQHHGLRLKVRVVQLRRVEVVEAVGLLQRQQLRLVALLEAIDHAVVRLRLFLAPHEF